MEIRKVAKRMLPATFRRWRARLIVLRHRRLNSTRSARNVFSEIYAKNLWGGTPGTYCSGGGSEEKQTEQYVSYVRQFILEHGITSVVDLGCGDFRVGRCLLDGRATYLGIDVVPDLIDYNTKTFGSDKIRFQCLDITTNRLPPADLCLIRQVLQHLSHAQISSIINRLGDFRYSLITEHFPGEKCQRRPNIDKAHGADVRLYDGSAVFLDQPPFSVVNLQLVLEEPALKPLIAEGEKLRTFLIEGPPIIG